MNKQKIVRHKPIWTKIMGEREYNTKAEAEKQMEKWFLAYITHESYS